MVLYGYGTMLCLDLLYPLVGKILALFFGTAGCSVRAVAMSVAHGASACVERRELGAAWRFEGHLLVSFFLCLKGCRDGSCPRSCAVGP